MAGADSSGIPSAARLVPVTLSDAACHLVLVTIGTALDLPPTTREKIEEAAPDPPWVPERRSRRIVCTTAEAEGLASFFTRSAGQFTKVGQAARASMCRQAAANIERGLEESPGAREATEMPERRRPGTVAGRHRYGPDKKEVERRRKMLEFTPSDEDLAFAIEVLRSREPETFYRDAWRALTAEQDRRQGANGKPVRMPILLAVGVHEDLPPEAMARLRPTGLRR